MRVIFEPAVPGASPRALARGLRGVPGVVLLESPEGLARPGRYSFVTAAPFLRFRSSGWHCELELDGRIASRFANPWRALEDLLARYELLDQPDVPFPLGGCFGWWGYELRRFVEPRLPAMAERDLDLPDCEVGFYDSLVAFDHLLGKSWVISTGLHPDGTRSRPRARARADFWQRELEHAAASTPPGPSARPPGIGNGPVRSNLGREAFLARVTEAQRYIRAGHIYQVNLSHRLAGPVVPCAWGLYECLAQVSPGPHAAFFAGRDHALASASPELFLRLSGTQARTRPIKGTRPRSADATEDAAQADALCTSAKERAELLMITDLLRNDLGKLCEFGSVTVPELQRLERFSHVQHLVSTVEGRLRPGVNHLLALEACFPGGSISGAPKIRALEIIDELEPVARGPYTGCLGYLGFNRESQLSILIRTAICTNTGTWFPVGAGIVADSDPAAEYEETLAKGRAFLEAVDWARQASAADAPVNLTTLVRA